MKQFLLDEMDLEFVASVKGVLEEFLGEHDVNAILEKSSFMSELMSNPEYVYHFDEIYWAELVCAEYQASKSQVQ